MRHITPNKKTFEWVVSEHDHGKELLEAIHEKLRERAESSVVPSKKAIKRAIDQGACHVNNSLAKRANFLIARRDRISFDSQFLLASDQNKELSLLYSEGGVIALSKPAFVETSEISIQKLIARHSQSPLYLVHRLDQNTSGVLLIAETEEIQKKLERLFKKREIEKTYIAIVHGKVEQDEGVCTIPLVRESVNQGKEIYVRGAQRDEAGSLPAVTRWKRLIAHDEATLVAAFPETGRTHQIRAHFSLMGHPLVGDVRYSNSKSMQVNITSKRHLLHALKLKFNHPVTNKSVVVYDRIPEDMRVSIQRLFGPLGERLICEL